MARIHDIELPSANIAPTKTFHADASVMALADFGPGDAATTSGDVDLGLQGDAAEATAAPLPVIAVDDLETTLASVLAAGGTVTRAIFAFPSGRRFQSRDPNGNELAAVVVA